MTAAAPSGSDAIAQAYSATGAAWQRGPARVYDRLAETVVAAAPTPLTGRAVLDLGAGTGAATRAIRAAGATPIAADIAEGMLRAISAPQPSRVVADARRLPFADRCLDGVVASFSLNHLPDPARALREAKRVVRPGSPLLVSAYATEDAHPVKEAVNQAATELGWHPDQWVDDLRAISIPLLATLDSAREVAVEAGLSRAEVRLIEVAFPDLDAHALVAWRCGMAQVAPFVEALTPPERERLHARAIALLGEAPPLVRHVVVLAAIA